MRREQEAVYIPRKAELLEVRQFTAREKYFRVRLSDGSALGHMPGQFTMVSVPGVGEAPISVSSSPTAPGADFEFCIRNAGNVTGALHKLKAGDSVGIRGPFGRGFPVEELKGYDLLFVAGGLGLVPLRSMINYAIDRRGDFGSLTLLYGARTPGDILFRDELDRWKAVPDFHIESIVDVADSSWSGHVGPITALFERVQPQPSKTMALVVGPPVMFRFVIKGILGRGIYESRVYLSLERRMKCGLGKCGHCQVDTVYVCQKGPVFPYTKLRYLPEAF